MYTYISIFHHLVLKNRFTIEKRRTILGKQTEDYNYVEYISSKQKYKLTEREVVEG